MKLDAYPSKTARVVESIEEQIRSGILQRGDILRSTRLLAQDFQVSQQVIRYACDELEKKGLIKRKARCGTQITGTGKLLIVRFRMDERGIGSIILSELCAMAHANFLETEIIPLEYIRTSDRQRLLQSLKHEHYLGVALFACGYLGSEPELPLLHELGIPVCIPAADCRDHEVTGFKCFTLDSAKGIRLTARELKNRGYRRVGVITGNRNDAEFCNRIWQEEGLIPMAADAIPTMQTESVMKEQIEQFLSRNTALDAVACHSGILAALIYERCRRKNILIPNQLGVINFGWGGAGKFLSPKLTELDYRLKEIGQMTLSWLLTRTEDAMPEIKIIQGGSL